jgi:hypothetical protein
MSPEEAAAIERRLEKYNELKEEWADYDFHLRKLDDLKDSARILVGTPTDRTLISIDSDEHLHNELISFLQSYYVHNQLDVLKKMEAL